MKKYLWLTLICVALSVFAACGTKNSEAATDEIVGMANPWTDSDKQGVLDATGFDLTLPESATKAVYSYMESDKLAQVSYNLDGYSWNFRVQPSSELTDISGVYYEWTSERSGKLNGCEALYTIYSEGEDENAYAYHVLNWFDSANGVLYSLSVDGEGVNNLDIQGHVKDLITAMGGTIKE